MKYLWPSRDCGEIGPTRSRCTSSNSFDANDLLSQKEPLVIFETAQASQDVVGLTGIPSLCRIR
jgi:hypothetical protein